MIPGAMMQFDLADGFPAPTTKKFAFVPMKGELCGFLQGKTSAADYRDLGCKIWDQNANENEAWLNNPWRTGEDDLGYMYARLWNDMPVSGEMEGEWNQIDRLIHGIVNDPTSRRLIVSAWHPEVFDRAALPPCHVLFQVIVDQTNDKLHMTMYQRSCDLFLGVPFNVASYSLLLSILCRETGYKPGTFTWFGADVHIYENHMEQVKEQLSRKPLPLCKLVLDYDVMTRPHEIKPEQIRFVDYVSHDAIKAPMAV
jgi:thymidylate synthase